MATPTRQARGASIAMPPSGFKPPAAPASASGAKNPPIQRATIVIKPINGVASTKPTTTTPVTDEGKPNPGLPVPEPFLPTSSPSPLPSPSPARTSVPPPAAPSTASARPNINPNTNGNPPNVRPNMAPPNARPNASVTSSSTLMPNGPSSSSQPPHSHLAPPDGSSIGGRGGARRSLTASPSSSTASSPRSSPPPSPRSTSSSSIPPSPSSSATSSSYASQYPPPSSSSSRVPPPPNASKQPQSRPQSMMIQPSSAQPSTSLFTSAPPPLPRGAASTSDSLVIPRTIGGGPRSLDGSLATSSSSAVAAIGMMAGSSSAGPGSGSMIQRSGGGPRSVDMPMFMRDSVASTSSSSFLQPSPRKLQRDHPAIPNGFVGSGGKDCVRACRDRTERFLVRRKDKVVAREGLFGNLIQRLAQLSITRLAKEEEKGILSTLTFSLLGTSNVPVVVKGTNSSGPAAQDTHPKCYCGRAYGFFGEKRVQCELCQDYMCGTCVQPRVPLHFVNRMNDSAFSAVKSIPTLGVLSSNDGLNACVDCARLAMTWERCVDYRQLLLKGGAHELLNAYRQLTDCEQELTRCVSEYSSLVGEILVLDKAANSFEPMTQPSEGEAAPQSTTSTLSYAAAYTAAQPDPRLATVMADATEIGWTIEDFLVWFAGSINDLAGPIESADALEPKSARDQKKQALRKNETTQPPQPDPKQGPNGASPDGGPSSTGEISPPGAAGAVVVQNRAMERLGKFVFEWRPKNMIERELLGNIVTYADSKFYDHKRCFTSLHKQILKIELRSVTDVYGVLFQLSVELKDFCYENKQEQGPGMDTYLIISDVLHHLQSDLEGLLADIREEDWPQYQIRIRRGVKEELANGERLLSLPPMLKDKGVETKLTFVMAKCVGIVQHEEKTIVYNTANNRFSASKRSISGLLDHLAQLF